MVLPLMPFFLYIYIHIYVYIYVYIYIYLFIYLFMAAPGGTWDLCCGMWDLLVVACRLLSCSMQTSYLWHVNS